MLKCIFVLVKNIDLYLGHKTTMMSPNLPSSNLPVKKKWHKPDFVIIDSNQPAGGGVKSTFVERSGDGVVYHIQRKGQPSTVSVGKGTFDRYHS
ncbi:hypothetical protein HK413_01610 [Mucilaginibacter sp. S1162]|uniref:Uncharacterized protein n=1 Tax=Mucilaginibacter humi TaxID=2732510 RepID=A0ABX1W0S3_9SPHI|nr:hypothetical protein [Mucilaginibacter humi]NNU33198.1 hypothetical protein [Mucilaginibacter humi]